MFKKWASVIAVALLSSTVGIVGFAVSAQAANPPGLTVERFRPVSDGVNSDLKVYLSDSASEPVTVTFISYSLSGDLNADMSTKTVSPGSSVTLHVATPPCGRVLGAVNDVTLELSDGSLADALVRQDECDQESPDPTPTPTETESATPTPTPSETVVESPSPTPSETVSESPTPSPTPTITESVTASPTPSISESVLPSATPSPSATPTVSVSPSPTVSASVPPVVVPSATPTATAGSEPPFESPEEDEVVTPTPTASETAESPTESFPTPPVAVESVAVDEPTAEATTQADVQNELPRTGAGAIALWAGISGLLFTFGIGLIAYSRRNVI